MRVKLTDLLDDLELDPELLPLPKAKRPTRARTERLVLQRLGISRRRVRSAGRTLLAAVLAALLSLGAVAGVLGLRALSRNIQNMKSHLKWTVRALSAASARVSG